MIKQSTQVFDDFVEDTNPYIWGSEGFVGIIRLSKPLISEQETDMNRIRAEINFRTLVAEKIESLFLSTLELEGCDGEWETHECMEAMTPSKRQKLYLDAQHVLNNVLPDSSDITLDAFGIKETPEELDHYSPDTRALAQCYFVKVVWFPLLPEHPYIFIINADELVKNGLRGIEREATHYLMTG